MFHAKPIIGLLGGIGSGKSYVAKIFGEEGCLVIDSDAQVAAAYREPKILSEIRAWWGDAVFNSDGSLNRSAVAKIVFADPAERHRLESLLHPWVDGERSRAMASAPAETIAFVWDTPLLLEAGLNVRCDALVFVEAPDEERLNRVQKSRNWNAAELLRREKLQLPLDKKREISDYRIVNTAGSGNLRKQVRQILSRITGLPSPTQ